MTNIFSLTVKKAAACLYADSVLLKGSYVLANKTKIIDLLALTCGYWATVPTSHSLNMIDSNIT